MRPLSINADRAKKMVTVIWDDGHRSDIGFSLLRAGCPCAECRGGHENMSQTPGPEIFLSTLPDSPATRLVNLVPVGAYALAPVWEDGHDAGIYKWDYLRALCPCEECQPKIGKRAK